jgi:hypothetical protein
VPHHADAGSRTAYATPGWTLTNNAYFVPRHAAACSDEVYANSVFDESQQFVSAAHLLQQEVQGMEGAEHAGAALQCLLCIFMYML